MNLALTFAGPCGNIFHLLNDVCGACIQAIPSPPVEVLACLRARSGLMSEPQVYESVLFKCPQVDVFVVPPPTGRGFRTESWGSLASPIFNGRLKVIDTYGEAGSRSACEIRIEDAHSGDLFAAAPYIGEHAVERARDSSRYYQLRVVQGKRVAHLGIGFSDRDASFDFQVALADYWKRVTVGAAEIAKLTKTPQDYSLKQGEMLTISVEDKAKDHIMQVERTDSPGVIPFLMPPPSASEVRKQMAAQRNQEDDFGDFQ